MIAFWIALIVLLTSYLFVKAGKTAIRQKGKASRSKKFVDLKEEIQIEKMVVEGTLPKGMDCNLFAVAPAFFETAQKKRVGFIDGLPMLHSFHIHEGRASYISRFVRSGYYAAFRSKEGPSALFASLHLRSLRAVKSLFTKGGDSKTIHPFMAIGKIAGQLLLYSRTGKAVEIDAKKLSTQAPKDCCRGCEKGGRLEMNPPFVSEREKDKIGCYVFLGGDPRYVIYKRMVNGECETIAEIMCDPVSFFERMGLSQRWVILPLGMLCFDPKKAHKVAPFAASFHKNIHILSEWVVINRIDGHAQYLGARGDLGVVAVIAAWDEGDFIHLVWILRSDVNSYVRAFDDPHEDKGGTLYHSILDLEQGQVRDRKITEEWIVEAIPQFDEYGVPLMVYATTSQGEVLKISVNLGALARFSMDKSTPSALWLIPSQEGGVAALFSNKAAGSSSLVFLSEESLKKQAALFIDHPIERALATFTEDKV